MAVPQTSVRVSLRVLASPDSETVATAEGSAAEAMEVAVVVGLASEAEAFAAQGVWAAAGVVTMGVESVGAKGFEVEMEASS